MKTRKNLRKNRKTYQTRRKIHKLFHFLRELCYNIIMNKDVIYIEPEDDITSIIRKMNSSKNKLVALVPPKRIGVLRSAVNTRLIAKNAKQSGKTVVIVSTDPSLVKLSAAAGIPVADTLQSRPKLPDQILGTPAKEAIPSEITIEEDKTLTIAEEKSTDDAVDEVSAEEAETSKSAKTFSSAEASKNTRTSEPAEASKNAKMSDFTEEESSPKKGPRLAKTKIVDDEINSVELEEDSGDKKDGKKKKIPDLDRYKKWIITGSVAGVLLIAFVIWALIFAPAVKINVAVRTTANNFSENITLVTNTNSEKAEEGVFYIEKQTYEATNSVDFTATGEKEVGEKATGTINVAIYGVVQDEPVVMPAGTVFTNTSTGLRYALNKDVTYSTENEDEDNCTTVLDKAKGRATYSCDLEANLSVTAEDIGDKYNLAAGNVNWTMSVSANAKMTNNALTGGTSETVKIVQQSDIDAAKAKLKSASEETDKAKLLAQFSKDMYIIEASYKVDEKEPTPSIKVGEEVKDGVTPKLSQVTTYSIYGVDTNKLSSFIKTKTAASIASDQKIYEVGSPFLENFRESDNSTYAARLKSTTQTGPSVTEEEILEKSKGRKIGEVQSLLKSINGVSSVKIDKSFFWVNSVPDDPNKIEIELKVEE